MTDCRFCIDITSNVIWRDERCRITHAVDQPFVGWCRVIWNAHFKEITDLSPEDRMHLMRAVFAVESGLRKLLDPVKINMASLGTGLPHVHWHIVPRFADDTHFPEPVWSPALRVAPARRVPRDFEARMTRHLQEELGEGI
jgi:diadenosine tetraphosphate (Ap4A) HIT family hydrolase